ncbi:S1/P1 nuclease [Kumtagia ephedrae]|uniref:Endonuclease n=1 Tax=Kumtagia ephedrae TaxID=2116701 RepID=A0A2P7S040_9HYPH|nr:S1/P1 nuclease [Mesorhizobium ephedrae]PSJ55848.1 hypothetical protein C7I84_22310 [Mesorhizobium ephedrae]
MRRILSALAMVIALSAPASAWTWSGHAIVAEIAERHLSSEAKKAVSGLLAVEGQKSLVDVSLWADLVKVLRIPGQPSHVVRLPLDDSGYNAAKVCRKNRCATAAVERYAAILHDRTRPADERLAALKYVVHLVGDLHQPLHASADTGGRAVVLDGKVTRLHDVWDDAIVARQGKDWRELADAVEAAPTGPIVPSTPAGWALEGRDIARDTIFTDPRIATTRRDVLPTLPEAYLDDNWPVVRARLKQAGYRLAHLLEEALGPGD